MQGSDKGWGGNLTACWGTTNLTRSFVELGALLSKQMSITDLLIKR